MRTIDFLSSKALEYATEKRGKKTMISNLIFREENGDYYAGFMVLENNSHEDLRIKRPTNWLILDIKTAELKEYYDIKDNDFSNLEKFPLDMKFGEKGNSNIDGYSNFIIHSYQDWEKNVLANLNKKIENQEYGKDENMLFLKNITISSKDFILNNAETILNNCRNNLFSGLRDQIETGLQNNYYKLSDEIINGYQETNTINIEDNEKYLNLIKYIWIDMANLIDEFDNISR